MAFFRATRRSELARAADLGVLSAGFHLAYALIRAAADGNYPYPFLDVHKIGAGGVAVNCAMIAAGFVGAGFVSVALDKRRADSESG